jgi:hypothetical protein
MQEGLPMTRKALDWKFLATIGITLVGLIIPFFLWQLDLASHSLTVRLLSTSPLQPVSNIQNLQISVNGQNIESPYLSTFELLNDGSKPIPRSDFESPIEIITIGDAKLINAQTTGTYPKNIPAQLTNNDRALAIAPFLSNPNDSVSIAVITSGPSPLFEVHARIAGVDEVTYENRSVGRDGYLKVVLSIVVSCSSLFMYFVFMFGGVRGSHFATPRALAFLAAISCGMASALTLHPLFQFLKTFSSSEHWRLAVIIPMTLAMMLVANWYIRTIRRKDASTHMGNRNFPS